MSGIAEWLETAREERWGILTDLMFAILWVTAVDVFFTLVDGPRWAYYMFMLAGIVAYYGFFMSLKLARANQE
ncbi:hypothetical protein ACFO5R_17545 [Halosolutus amylolyticus]|uniref:DUF8119 domain-containing protein n=1 Tax=Halosolutus amylolyticus TaxID=2932267 RepID=A0ABD5PUV6_9EURY|nr:hypothetical protein [Halosolutus amylolyticus]